MTKTRVSAVVIALTGAVCLLLVIRKPMSAKTGHTTTAARPGASSGRLSTSDRVVGRKMAPPKFRRLAIPDSYRRGDEARWNATDEQYAQWLEVVPWGGPTPKNLGELPNTPETRKRLEEYGNDSDIDFQLKLLADLDLCFAAEKIPEGGAAVVAFFFDYEGDTAVVAKEPVIEATSIDPEYEGAFKQCLTQTFAGKSFRAKRTQGNYMHVWPTTIPVPVRNHELFPWLFSKDT